MNKQISKYFSNLGKKGGSKSKRKLSKEEASRMGKLSAEKRKQQKEQEKLKDT